MKSFQTILNKLKNKEAELDTTTIELLEKQKIHLGNLVKMKNLVIDVHKTNPNKITLESLEKMQDIIQEEEENPKPIVVAFFGKGGSGKSSFINKMIGSSILPNNSGESHVTRTLFHVSHSETYSMEVVMCTEKEIKERCEKTNYDFKNVGEATIDEEEICYDTLKELVDALNELSLTESDIYRIKLIRVKAVLPEIESKFEVIDVPGLHSGDSSKIFERLAYEAGKLADRIVLFSNSFRSDIPTDMFELIGDIFNDPIVQRNPKTFCFCVGGRYYEAKSASGQYSSYLNTKIAENHKSFVHLLSDYFDYKFDDIPRARNEKLTNNRIVFVENKRDVLELLKDNFITFPIPHDDSKSNKEESTISKLYFEIMLKQDRLIHIRRMVQKLRELALLCIPNLMIKSKFQTCKSKQESNTEIMNDCYGVVKDIVEKMRKAVENNGCFKKRLSKLKEKNFLLDVMSTEVVQGIRESEKDLIIEHLIILEEFIQAVATKCLIKDKGIGKKEKVNNFAGQVLPLFDLNHEDHIVLATEMKGVLNELFVSFIQQRNSNYEHKFNINYCAVIRDENNGSVLRLPNRTYPDIKSMTGAKITANSDSLVKAGKYRNDQTQMQVIPSPSRIDLPVVSSIIELTIKKNKTIEIDNTNPQPFDSFKDMLPSSILLNHEKKTRIAPLFFLSLDGTSPNLAFDSCWAKYSTESLIVIVTPQEHVDNFVDLVQKSKSNEQHHVKILSVAVENELYSEGSLMNAVFDFSQFCDFPIIHIVKLCVKEIFEYVSPLKEYISNEWTPIRYFRSAEAIVYQEINSLNEKEKEEKVQNCLIQATDIIVKKKLANDKINKLRFFYNVKEALNDTEGFIECLREIDSKSSSNLEKEFKSSFFSKNKGRVGCWDGLTRNIDKNKIYSRDGYNYMISNYSTAIETYFMQAIDKIRPVADVRFTQDLRDDGFDEIDHGFDSKMINFRTNMLAHGVGGFLHFGFKYSLNRNEKKKQKQQATKRKNIKKNNSNPKRTKK